MNNKNCELLDYIDLDTLKEILEAFTNCTDFMANIVDVNGKSLFSKKDISKCSRFCKTIYSLDGGVERCQKAYCRAGKQAALFNEPYIFRCPAGLIEWAAPVMLGNKHIATIICGQVLMWEPEEFFWLELKEMNSYLTQDLTPLIEAAKELPVVSGEKVRSALKLLFIISNYIVNYQNHQKNSDTLSEDNDTEENSYSDITNDCIAYMREHIGENLNVDDIAKATHFSVSYVSKTFKKDTGKTLIDFLIDMRIESACKLLTSDGYKIKEISTAIGFDDQNYFSRLFNKKIGMSPSEYRKKFKKEN